MGSIALLLHIRHQMTDVREVVIEDARATHLAWVLVARR